MGERIPFNKPFIAGKELYYIAQAVTNGRISGDGYYTRACAGFLEERFGIHKVLMTPSCTAALEMAAMLCDLQPGDEVIMPSFTFVSTANAVVRMGARPRFVDIRSDTLNMDESLIEDAITPKTRAIFAVHYGGVGCDMDRLVELARHHKLRLIEDAAQGVHAAYRDRALGSIGDLGCYSFHETKNYICGEGGSLCINDPELAERAEVIREKGTNRSQFFRGEVDKYTWVAEGSSYVPSEIVCAFLYGQLEQLEQIAARRREIYTVYEQELRELANAGHIRLPRVPDECQSNCHLYYVLVGDAETRSRLLKHLNERGIQAVFHYVPLHTSPMGQKLGGYVGQCPVTEELSECLIRLPMYFDIQHDDQMRVVDALRDFFQNRLFSDP